MSVTILEEVPHWTPLAELTLSGDADRGLIDEPLPPMPTGYAIGMHLYFIGSSFKTNGNNWLLQGMQGEVVGPAVSKNFRMKGVAMRFPNNRTPVDCSLDELSVSMSVRAASPRPKIAAMCN